MNSKYIKIKQNRKRKIKFFGPFQVLHPVGKQAYKLKLHRKEKIHNVFHMSLLEQDTTKKRRINENNATKLDPDNNEGSEYEVEAICDSAVYARKSKSDHFLGLYYLVSWKGYLEEKNTWEPYLAVQHLNKLINLFYKDYFDKPTAISKAINTVPPMDKLIIKPTAPKQKQG